MLAGIAESGSQKMRAHTKKSAPQHTTRWEHQVQRGKPVQCLLSWSPCTPGRMQRLQRGAGIAVPVQQPSPLSPRMGLLLCAALSRLSGSCSSTHICWLGNAAFAQPVSSAGWKHSLGSHGFSFKGGAERCLSFGADWVLCWHLSLLEYSGLELVVCCKKINSPLRRLEEKSRYLIRGFAIEDESSCSSRNALFLTLLLC